MLQYIVVTDSYRMSEYLIMNVSMQVMNIAAMLTISIFEARISNMLSFRLNQNALLIL